MPYLNCTYRLNSIRNGQNLRIKEAAKDCNLMPLLYLTERAGFEPAVQI